MHADPIDALVASLLASWDAPLAAEPAAAALLPEVRARLARAASRERRPIAPSRRPVLAHLDDAVAGAPEGDTDALARAIAGASPRLGWTIGYADQRDDPALAAFVEGYAFAWLAGPAAGPLVADDLGVYLTLQAPDVAYPAHAHPAVELYQVVSGTATWWRTSDGQQRRLPGEVLLHGSGEAHAMRTWGMPLLSVCIWLDALDRPSRMVDGEAVNRKGSDPF